MFQDMSENDAQKAILCRCFSRCKLIIITTTAIIIIIIIIIMYCTIFIVLSSTARSHMREFTPGPLSESRSAAGGRQLVGTAIGSFGQGLHTYCSAYVDSAFHPLRDGK